MAAKIPNVDSYYQTFIKNGLHILPHTIAIILIIQLVIQRIVFYFNAQWNKCIGFIILLLNCTIEDEIENTLNSYDGDYRENINAEDCDIINFDEYSGLNSSSNATNSTQDFNDSVSDIEILRGGSDDETTCQTIGSIEDEIHAKTVSLQNKRHELCGRLLAYKLMEFQIDVPLHSSSNSPETGHWPKSPLPVAEEIDFKVPSPAAYEPSSSPAYQPPFPPFIPEYEASYGGFTCEEMLARAIQASLDDVAANVTPSREESSLSKLPGESSGSPQTTPGKIPPNQSTPSRFNENNPHLLHQSPVVNFMDMWKQNYAQDVEKDEETRQGGGQNVMEDFMESDRYVNQTNPPNQITPSRFNENNPHLHHQSPVVNFMDMWNQNYAQDVEKDEETRQEDSQNVVMEDFMEGDRYVGDKGKRPMSGRYAYKKRSKPSKSDAEEPGPSGSSDVLKKDLAAE